MLRAFLWTKSPSSQNTGPFLLLLLISHQLLPFNGSLSFSIFLLKTLKLFVIQLWQTSHLNLYIQRKDATKSRGNLRVRRVLRHWNKTKRRCFSSSEVLQLLTTHLPPTGPSTAQSTPSAHGVISKGNSLSDLETIFKILKITYLLFKKVCQINHNKKSYQM